jgi:hypothetical protein
LKGILVTEVPAARLSSRRKAAEGRLVFQQQRTRMETENVMEECFMKCGQCNANIERGEEREHLGRVLCEDCYMDALSPTRTCDPWAVHSAKRLEEQSSGPPVMTPLQREMMAILEEQGKMEPTALLAKLKGKLTASQLEREVAALRHMEKVRYERKGDKIVLRLW